MLKECISIRKVTTMAYAPVNHYDENKVAGRFDEVEYGNTFEYGFPQDNAPFGGFETKIYVGDCQTRWAKILKTVAYIVVDEDENGNPVTEKWQIKNRKDYK